MNKYALQIITMIFLAVAVLFDSDDLPYGFFTILHFVVCFYFGYKAYLYYIKEKSISFMFCFLALFAITYNPFVKAKFDSGEWLFINIPTIAFIVYTEFLSFQIIKKCAVYLFKISKILIIPAIMVCIFYSIGNHYIKKQERLEREKIRQEEQNQLFTDLGHYTAIFEYIPERCKKAGHELKTINYIKENHQQEITLLFKIANAHFVDGKNSLLDIYKKMPQEMIDKAAQKGWGQVRTAAIIAKIMEKQKNNPKEFEKIITDILNTGNVNEAAEKYISNQENFEVILLNLLKTVDTSKYDNLITDKDVCMIIEKLFKDDSATFTYFLKKYHRNIPQRYNSSWIIE